MTVDLDAYFARIGYRGTPAPSYDTLAALHELHPRAIPFENLDPWLRRRVELAPAALERKLVHQLRGGYCYEHNGLFAHVLRAIGFEVRSLAARVRWGVTDDVITPRTHMVLLVDLPEGTWLADVGFGVLTPTSPLRLATSVEQPTAHETLRLISEGDTFVLEARIRTAWRPVYAFDLVPQRPVDFEVFNWYVSTHPRSRFVGQLIATRPTVDGRISLRDRELNEHRLDGTTTHRTIDTPAALRRILEHDFGLGLVDLPELDDALQRLFDDS